MSIIILCQLSARTKYNEYLFLYHHKITLIL